MLVLSQIWNKKNFIEKQHLFFTTKYIFFSPQFYAPIKLTPCSPVRKYQLNSLIRGEFLERSNGHHCFPRRAKMVVPAGGRIREKWAVKGRIDRREYCHVDALTRAKVFHFSSSNRWIIPPSSMSKCSSFVPFRMINSAEFQSEIEIRVGPFAVNGTSL